MQVETRQLSWFVDRIKNRVPFSFSRWGDGEWHSVLGRTRGANCDRHSYFPAMGAELRGVLAGRPPYVLGLQSLAVRVFQGKIANWVAARGLVDLDWVDADVFHHASGNGSFKLVVEALKSVPLVVVGPPHLAKLKDYLGVREFVFVPPRNAYLALDQIFRDTMGLVENMPVGTVVAVSASMPANIVVDKVHARVGKRVSVIDFGSVFDPYAGVKSRRYMQGMDVEIKEQ